MQTTLSSQHIKPAESITPLPHALFYLVIAVLTSLCLWPIWSLDFLPMQDYPQHLFISHITSHINDPALNYSQYYQSELQPGPYSFFYLALELISGIVPTVIAGKIFVSCYILLLTFLAARLARRVQGVFLPWGSLLLFPFAFHQMYFLGFTNFIISVPITILALLDLEDFIAHPMSMRSVLRHILYLILLLVGHPYMVLVYITLACAGAIFSYQEPGKLKRALLPPLVLTAIFLSWYLLQQDINARAPDSEMLLLWWPFKKALAFYFLPFTGMRWNNGVDGVAIILWGLISLLLVYGIIVRKRDQPWPWKFTLYFCLVIAGFFMLPFWVGKFAYFNLRLAPFSYLLLAILAGNIKIPRAAGLALAILSGALIMQSATLQKQVSRETAEIAPILARMPKNARILPIMFDSNTKILDPDFFHETHAHDFFYYHVLVGGGVNPYLFPNAMIPVRLKTDIHLPIPDPDGFDWRRHGAPYQFIMTRGAPPEFIAYMKRYADVAGESGRWLLFANRF